MMKEPELRECPFCDGKVTIEARTPHDEEAGNKTYAFIAHDISCILRDEFDTLDADQFQAWNRRMTATPIDETPIAAMRRALLAKVASNKDFTADELWQAMLDADPLRRKLGAEAVNAIMEDRAAVVPVKHENEQGLMLAEPHYHSDCHVFHDVFQAASQHHGFYESTYAAYDALIQRMRLDRPDGEEL